MEWIRSNILLDCAHNSDGASQLADYLRTVETHQRKILLFGASNDKDIRAMAIQLAGQVDEIYTCKCRHPRAALPTDLAKQMIDLPVPAIPSGTIEETLAALDLHNQMIIVTGSVFLVGAARDILS